MKNAKKENMREFNLEEAKAGKPVCTRDGKDARIICFDRETDNGFSVLALVKKTPTKEELYYYNREGRYISGKEGLPNDLFMKPMLVKRYIVAYPVPGRDNRDIDWNIEGFLYSSQEDAEAALRHYTGAVIEEIELEY